MIIRQWQDVIDGRKTQTRRVIDRSKALLFDDDFKFNVLNTIQLPDKNGNYRTRWQVGKVYAMVPKMGKPGVGFYRITALSAECLQDITEADAIAEGILPFVQLDMSMGYTCRGIDAAYPTARACYRALWESMGTRWNDDQYVVVIGIEYVGTVRPCTTH